MLQHEMLIEKGALIARTKGPPSVHLARFGVFTHVLGGLSVCANAMSLNGL
jgi:hypothetical protein